ncbi:glutaredoxin-3 [Leptolyngbya sp. Heron Island J]|uniref:glutaredoxin domain-containing protein n=1 Tax=Leptolyngbya sp. Heron Island J TaxID=1385935 RepID=UPI0003B9B7A4|nr:glutaredoxin domain-containing protein [Leptolyngbya sp. Heron Island J]ESA33932.1 glutaredoxin-3 [Leptolyngbya sp. Heron Island J]
MGQISIFWKEGCPHCSKAKNYLTARNITYQSLDITEDAHLRMLSIYLSGSQTVPQIFFNDEHIGGASDMLSIEPVTLDKKIQETLAAADLDFPPHVSDAELANAELPLGKILDRHIPDLGSNAEINQIKPYYEALFGFLPNMYDYMAIVPDYTTAWVAAFLSLFESTSETLGDFRMVVTFTTSAAAACTYCTAHATGAALDIGTTPTKLRQIFEFYQHPEGKDDSVLPFTEAERLMIRVARGAALNQVSDNDLAQLRQLEPDRGDELILNVGAATACFGFFNRFNDLMGVELEAPALEAAQNSLGSQWDVGKHDSQERHQATAKSEEVVGEQQKNLEWEKAFVIQMQGYLETVIGNNLNAYLTRNFEIVPNWLLTLPEAARTAVSHLYVLTVAQGQVSVELKHLMLYVLTNITGHQYLNTLEGFLAKRSAISLGASPELAQRRLEQSLEAAKVKGGTYKDFSQKECAALWLAKTASVYPPFTPSPLVLSLKEYYTPEQIVELTMCLAVGGLAQRWTATMKTESDTFGEVECVL